MEESQDMKQRKRQPESEDHQPEPDTTQNPPSSLSKPRRMAMARRGIRSLAIAVTIPFFLTLLSIHVSTTQQHSAHSTISLKKPFWFPPLWALHVSTVASTLLMGLSAWLVWAEGGFHREPAMLVLYLVQLGFNLVWDPVVLGMGMGWLGVVICLGMFGSLVGCSRRFREVNPIAGDLVKLCLAWVAFLALSNLWLAFLSASATHDPVITI